MLTSVSVTAKTAKQIRPQFVPEVWDKIAVEMLKSVPDWRSHNFDMVEFEEAMEAVLPQMEQRTFADFEDVSPHLFPAFERVAKSPPKAVQKITATTKVKTRITAAPKRWTPEQWELVTLELHRLVPTAFAERLVKVGNKHAESAQKVLPVHLHRHFVQVVDFRAHCLKIWDALPADVRNPELQERKIVDFTSGPVMAPVAKKSDSENAMATAIQDAFKAPALTIKPRKKHVSWSPQEWLAVAREMHRQNPHANYFSSQFFKMDLPALRDAQRVALIFERRKALKNSDGLREPLIEAFKTLRYELTHEVDAQIAKEAEELKATQTEEIAPAVIVEEPAAAPVIAETPSPVIAGKVPEVALLSNLEQVNFMGGLLNAAAPLAQFLVSQAASQMAPAIIAAIMPELKKQMGTMMQDAIQAAQNAVGVRIIEKEVVTHKTATAAPVAAPVASVAVAVPQVKPVHELALPVEKPKKPLIAILGPQGAQKAAIERDFPDYRFTFIEHGHGIKEAAAKAELFICAVANAPQALKHQIKEHLDPAIVRYLQNGGVSSIKRQINVWLASRTFA
jgi:hypothetical protein